MPSSIVYYTDHTGPQDMRHLCRDNLMRAAQGCEIITVGLNQPCGFGEEITYYGERGILTMHRQILAGLERARSTVVYLCEHDVLYSPTHFSFNIVSTDVWYYNTNVIHARWPDGRAVYWDNCQQVSGLCASWALLLDYYRQRIAQIEREGFNRHYEPGLKQTVGSKRVENRRSAAPNLDIRHGRNLTPSKWAASDFRNPQNAAGWLEMDKAPGWDALMGAKV